MTALEIVTGFCIGWLILSALSAIGVWLFYDQIVADDPGGER